MTTRHTRSDVRVIALDVRTLKFGYAVFEGQKRLLAFGLAYFAKPEAALRRFALLLRAYQPTVVVLCRSRNYRRPQTRTIVRAIHNARRSFGVAIISVTERNVRTYFADRSVRNKDQRAKLLSETYHQLATKLPPARRLWQHEHWFMPAFDAVAIGVTYFALFDEHIYDKHSRKGHNQI